NDVTKSPRLYAISFRGSLNTKLYRLFTFQVRAPAGSQGTLADDLQNPETIIKQLWTDRALGFPVTFIDPWNDLYQARILKMHQQQVLRQPDEFPEEVLDITMLEVSRGVSSLDFLYDTVQPDGV